MKEVIFNFEKLKVYQKSLDFIEKKIKNLNFFYDFKNAIKKNKGVSLISEIKKASPSAGVLIDDFDHIKIAKT